MIIESFEIENWSCIRHVSVADLPSTGVIVLHGSNGTGKSSIIEALRACLFDFATSSKDSDLVKRFTRNCPDAPTITVNFRSGNELWQIKKHYKRSGECWLKRQVPGGDWKLETSTPSEVHDRTNSLVGGNDSKLGLQQLLWLTQAEFHLPKPKKLDQTVHSRLRDVLGVLQTKLDDAFVSKVKKRWSEWFAAQQKPGEQPKVKSTCTLTTNRDRLNELKAEQDKQDARFRDCEGKARRLEELEIEARAIESH